MGVGLHQACSRGQEGVACGSWRVRCLLFADDVVRLVPSHKCLHLILEQFSAKCEAVGRWTYTKSESMVLLQKRMPCPLHVRGESLPSVEEFKYLRVLFMSEGWWDGPQTGSSGSDVVAVQGPHLENIV